MKLLPFDIEKAKAEARVVTRDGKKVRIICFDRESPTDKHIIALMLDSCGEECVYYYTLKGSRLHFSTEEHFHDLFIIAEPTYKPFSRETIPSDKWFINHHGDRLKITEAYLNDCLLGRTSYTYNEILNQFKFEDGSPCGIEE